MKALLVQTKERLHLKSFHQKLPLLGEKIVTASSMAAFEKRLIDKNPQLSEIFMDAAAAGMYHLLDGKVFSQNDFGNIVLLVGSGNNGGDAYALGVLLLKAGHRVSAYQLSDKLSDLSKKKREAFEREGGRALVLQSIQEIEFHSTSLVIDGLLGTGFKGEIKGNLLQLVQKLNESNAYVFSIDIPSGVSGDTGKVESEAVFANMTAYLGALKKGHLFEEGYEHVGILNYVDFGMDLSGLESDMMLANNLCLKSQLPKLKKKAHKYSVGKTIVIAGSSSMRGAAYLSTAAALRSGCGYVRLFTFAQNPNVIPEVISSQIDESEIVQNLSNAGSLLIGPGLGRCQEAKKIVDFALKLPNVNLVIDGDALFLMESPPKGAILTPHRGELVRLLGCETHIDDEQLIDLAQKYACRFDVIIICKGVPTVIVSPSHKKVAILAGNPGMATAGCGDVLAGICVSFVSQGILGLKAATLSVIAHGKAGDIAAKALSERSLIASDLLSSLPKVF